MTGYGADVSTEERVADREMLLALKINSMRMADQRDVIALCGGKVDAAKVVKHLAVSPKSIIREHLERLLSFLDNPKNRDSLKGVFVFSNAVLDRLLNRTVDTLKEIDKIL